MFLWLARRTSVCTAAICATLLAHAPPLVATATMATVDGIGSLLVVVGAYFMLEQRRFWLGAGVMSVSIGAHPGVVHTICVADSDSSGASCAARRATAPGRLLSQCCSRRAPACFARRVCDTLFGSKSITTPLLEVACGTGQGQRMSGSHRAM